jgi:hypothetical protein
MAEPPGVARGRRAAASGRARGARCPRRAAPAGTARSRTACSLPHRAPLDGRRPAKRPSGRVRPAAREAPATVNSHFFERRIVSICLRRRAHGAPGPRRRARRSPPLPSAGAGVAQGSMSEAAPVRRATRAHPRPTGRSSTRRFAMDSRNATSIFDDLRRLTHRAEDPVLFTVAPRISVVALSVSSASRSLSLVARLGDSFAASAAVDRIVD